MKPLQLYSRIPVIYQILLIVVFVILCICTLGLAFRYEDIFIQHKYYLNRKAFLKYISNKDFVLPENRIVLDGRVTEFNISYYKVWIYNKQSNIVISIDSPTDDFNDVDIIGLYHSNYSKYIINKIINRINYLKY